VARDTSHRAVGVAAIAFVSRVCLRLVTVRARVTNDAGEHCIVRRSDVAVGADGTMVRLLEPSMVERCAEPIGRGPGGVAGYASGRVLRSDMIRHAPAQRLRALPGGQMATITIGVRRSQRVVIADVARSAGRCDVGAGQSPARAGVIKFAIRPKQGVVARRTLRSREACGDVVGYAAAKRLRALPGGDVATITISIRRRERVIVVYVAIRAGHHFSSRRELVRSRQRPACGAVIKDRGVPCNRVVAGRAIRHRERRSGRGVRRVIRGLPGCQMALGVPTIRRRNRQAVVVADVAGSARRDQPSGRQLMRIRQREASSCVIER